MITEIDAVANFPSTRFQGSKQKIASWIWETIQDLKFTTVLDAFGGSGSIAWLLKKQGKEVTYNDILRFNWTIGLALIENQTEQLSDATVEHLLNTQPGNIYPTFIGDTFPEVYFTDDENRWLDIVVTNLQGINDIYQKALGYFALFQACLVKRPFNLFHRKNLYLRLSDVKRNFGNKTTWDRSFETLFRKYATEANRGVFNNFQKNRALNLDVFEAPAGYDLVYIDTPYISKQGIGTDYPGFYHFLEGLVQYPEWGQLIDYRTKHRRLRSFPSVWTNRKEIYPAFDRLFEKFRESILVVSYRSDGIPTIPELVELMKKYKRRVAEVRQCNYKYALSKKETTEVLLVGE
ncbi:MAG TPA: DNA adenine methylase [Bacillota bacterium]|nr:DNA adenine methylase [Bacillota bacterium]